MQLIIKNMVCPRCVAAVSNLVHKSGFSNATVHLGLVELADTPSASELNKFAEELKVAGFELLSDQNKQLIEQVKNLLIHKVQTGEIEEHFSLTKFLTKHIHKDYSSISRLFSEVEGITLEQFFILQKIEKAKELLIYRELALSEIAYHLGYSSSQHLSSQFKRVTGMTPSQFRHLGAFHRKSIDGLAS
jgi:AraC family transcriptional regulator